MPVLPPALGLPSQAVSVGGRRLQDSSMAIPAAGPSDAAQSSVSALGKRNDGGGTATCNGFSWELPLDSGQNDFRVTAMQNGSPVRPSYLAAWQL